MASTMRFDNWQTTDGTSIATTNASGDITFAGGVTGAGKILQVVSDSKLNVFSASVASAATADITGLAVTITPSSTSSKIYLSGMVYGSSGGLYFVAIDITRNGTNIIVPSSPSSRTPALSGARSEGASGTYAMNGLPIAIIDEPASTSALTYQVRVVNPSSSTRSMYINRNVDDTNIDDTPRAISFLIAMEVAG